MTRRLKIISGITVSVSLIAIGAFIFAVVAGFMIDDSTYVEDDPLPNTIEISNMHTMAANSKGFISWNDEYGNVGTVMIDIYTSGDFSYNEETSTFPENIEGGQETIDDAARELVEGIQTANDKDELELSILSVSIHPAGHGLITWYESIDGQHTEDTEIMKAMFEVSPESDVSFLDNEPEEDFRDSLVNAIQTRHKEKTKAINFMQGYMTEDLTEGTMQYASSQQISGEVSFTVKEDGEIIKNQDDWDTLPEMDEHTLEDFYHTAEQMISNWGMFSQPADE